MEALLQDPRSLGVVWALYSCDNFDRRAAFAKRLTVAPWCEAMKKKADLDFFYILFFFALALLQTG